MVFNIDNICFLSIKSAHLLFLKDHVTLKIGVIMLKIQLCITWINYNEKFKSVILNYNNIVTILLFSQIILMVNMIFFFRTGLVNVGL